MYETRVALNMGGSAVYNETASFPKNSDDCTGASLLIQVFDENLVGDGGQ